MGVYDFGIPQNLLFGYEGFVLIISKAYSILGDWSCLVDFMAFVFGNLRQGMMFRMVRWLVGVMS